MKPIIKIIMSERAWAIYMNVFMAVLFSFLLGMGFLALLCQTEKTTVYHWIVFIAILLWVIPLMKQSFLPLPPKADETKKENLLC